MTLQNLKSTLLICLALQIGSVFFGSALFAQQSRPVSTSEIGVGIGGANYKGEIAPNYRFLNNQAALTVFYRHDMSDAITLRGGLMGSHRIINDNTFSDEAYADNRPLHAYRQAESKFSLLEASAVMEYNFLDYYDLSQKVRVSPYVFVGVAGLLYNIKLQSDNPELGGPGGMLDRPFDTNIAVAVPFGVGVKYALSKHWNLGLEFGARKVLTDQLDYLFEEDPKNLANPYDKDWYYYNGISISYTLYRTNCPPVYKNKPGILD
ncbi:type IX secretion system protein PorG [Pontibacter sp. CAU 1760]